MRRIGIVGSEAAKFTPVSEARARALIRTSLRPDDVVISGGCHLGGIDIWAAQEARWLGCEVIEHKPASLRWTGGYKERNLLIVRDSDLVVCITVSALPEGYQGMLFPGGCYHCATPPEHHVKSGGCWTMKQARMAGKQTALRIIPN